MDGIAIVLIVLLHSITHYALISNEIANYKLLQDILNVFGIALFTYSSAMKFVINHSLQIDNKIFLKNYAIKRFFRLYKPYITYTFLVLPLLYIIKHISYDCIGLDFNELNKLNNICELNYWINLFFAGNNTIANHLWYLFALSVVGSFFFVILYISNIRKLYLIFPILVLISFLFEEILTSNYRMVFKIINLEYIFIFSIYFNLLKIENSKTYHKLNIYFSIIFLIIFLITIIQNNLFFLNYSTNLFLCSLTFPAFAANLINFISKIKLFEKAFIPLGQKSFYIYLFHAPIISEALTVIFLKILNINSHTVIFLVVLLTIWLSIIVYAVCKRLNLIRIFE